MSFSHHILYVGRFGLPETAAGIRVFNNIKILNEIGCIVHCLCLVNHKQKEINISDNICYHFDSTNPNRCIDKIYNVIELFSASKALKQVKAYIKKYSIDTVILYNDLFLLSWRLLKWAKKNNIKLVADVTEWYEQPIKKENLINRAIPYLTDKRIKFIDSKIKNIIAISPYLVDYYQQKQCNVLFLPPVFDVKHKSFKSEVLNAGYDNKLRFVYAGSIGNKDILAPFISAICNVNKCAARTEFHIIGISESELECYGDVDTLKQLGVHAYGRLSHQQTLEIVGRSDFSVLLRRPLRYAQAGFSTKFAESMSLGVPMLCNRVGGAEKIIEDRVDGVLLDSVKVEDLSLLIEELCEMPSSSIQKMKQVAYSKANKVFDYRNYIEQMRTFLE